MLSFGELHQTNIVAQHHFDGCWKLTRIIKTRLPLSATTLLYCKVVTEEGGSKKWG